MKVGDRVILDGKYHGRIVNISLYRPPEEAYAIDLDEYKDDYIFCSAKRLKKE